MSTTESYIEYIKDQFAFLMDFKVKKMFGEYGIYSGVRFFGVVCDDKLFFKKSQYLLDTIGDDGLRAYEGSKNTIHIPGEVVEDKEKLKELTLKYLN